LSLSSAGAVSSLPLAAAALSGDFFRQNTLLGFSID
jgi:hypothetical protein